MTARAKASIDIIRQSPQWTDRGLDVLIRRAATTAIAIARRPVRPNAEISVLLTDDARMRKLNGAWRGLDRPTNVLSFPAAGLGALADAKHLGDVILAFETIAVEASREGKSFADHAVHLVVHGVLHLLGHDHLTKAQAGAMEGLEVKALALLGIADPYEGGSVRAAAGRARA